jgi:hypothetical protein
LSVPSQQALLTAARVAASAKGSPAGEAALKRVNKLLDCSCTVGLNEQGKVVISLGNEIDDAKKGVKKPKPLPPINE